MQRMTKFFLNGSLLAVTSLLLRLTGLGFSAYMTLHLGAEGTGLLSLVTTVYGFGITLAVSGIYLACMRLCSSAIVQKNAFALHTAMQKSFLHAIVFGCMSFFILFNAASFLGTQFLGDARSTEAIKTLAIALPFIAMTTVTDSYFASVGRVYKSAISDIVEEVTKIFIGILLLKSALPFGIEAGVTAVTKGNCIGEIIAFIVSFIMYHKDIKTFDKQKQQYTAKTESLLRISLPIALSTYARSGLVTIEHSLIPKGLQQYGQNKSNALAEYGIVRGMSLPIILFPASVLSSFTGLLIPEFTEDFVAENRQGINKKASVSMDLSCVFSIVSASILFAFGKELGICIYKNADAGRFIRYFSFLIPFMYCDTTADSMLKGMDKQVYTMIVNIMDAAISVVMTKTLIPKYGLLGYIVTVFTTEILNFLFSFSKLASITELHLRPIHSVCLPLLICSITTALSRQLLTLLHITSMRLFCITGIIFSLITCVPVIMQFSFISLFQNQKTKQSRQQKTQRKPDWESAVKKAEIIR